MYKLYHIILQIIVNNIYRPIIPVKLFLDKKTVTFDALVNSGADEI